MNRAAHTANEEQLQGSRKLGEESVHIIRGPLASGQEW